MVNICIKVGVISFALSAIVLGIGLGVGVKREKNRSSSVKGSLAKESEQVASNNDVECGGRRILTVPGVEYDYQASGLFKQGFIRGLGTTAESGSNALVISEGCIGTSSNINRCTPGGVRRNLAKESVSNPRPATPSPTDTKSPSPAPSRTVTSSPAPTICNSNPALFGTPNDTLSPTVPLTTNNPSTAPTTPAPTTAAPTPEPTTSEPTTPSPTTSGPTTFVPTPGPTLEATPFPTSGSTPTVSTEVTGPPTRGGRGPL